MHRGMYGFFTSLDGKMSFWQVNRVQNGTILAR